MTTHDAARQLGKAYVGALNTGREAFAARFAPGARMSVAGAPATLDDVLRVAPPGRSAFRSARVEADGVVWSVRVRSRTDVDDREHRVRLDGDGRVTDLRA